jgi:UDP-N-acetylmuramyl pentapeptide phosphotransferase/UDP-N-acetylglucosamine-1-phosphate transferase
VASFLFLYSATSFTISLLFLPVLIKLLTQWKLFDSSGHHKIHEGFTPSMGGVPIVIGVIFSILIALRLADLINLKFFFISMALMFITGLRDDVLTLTPRDKLLSQLLPVIILVIFGDVVLNSFYGFLPDFVFPKTLSWGVSIFSIIIFTNAYNLIDGLDGLAGSIGVIALLCFGCWFFTTDNYPLSLISFVFAGSILAFLFFNWQPSRVFMGDTGALTIGFLLSFLAIQFVNQNYSLPEGHTARFQASIGTVICVLIIPVFDTLRVIILRLRRFESPFHADRNHLHHQFINLGFSHAQAVLIIGGINIFFIVLALILRNKSDLLILPLAIGICLIINQVLKVAQQRHGRKS